MKTKKKNRNTLLIITYIIALLTMAMTLLAVLSVAFNWFGVVEIVNEIMSSNFVAGYDINEYLSSFYINAVLTFLICLYYSVFFYKGIKYRVNNPTYARKLIIYSVILILVGAYLCGIFALITGAVMSKQKPQVISEKELTQSFLSDYKLMAMSEAVTRLKELRASGTISEEEYYASLNKILEG